MYIVKVFTCDWWYNVNCAASEDNYNLNTNLYKNDETLFGDSLGDDFDLSKLQKLLRQNSKDIESILKGTSSEKLLDKRPRSLSFSDISSPSLLERDLSVDNSVEDLVVSQQSKPGAFNVFYTVPRETNDQSKMKKIKELIANFNKETILSEKLRNSIEELEDEDDEYYYYDDEEEYGDEYDDEEYYDEEDYYAEDSMQSIRTLKKPPGESDDIKIFDAEFCLLAGRLNSTLTTHACSLHF